MSDDQERRDWALPPELAEGQGLVRDDESDRETLVLHEHPELEQAIEDDLDEIAVNGQAMNPRMHIMIHTIVANQLWVGDPPETWETARRLTALGYDRHEVLHMLGGAVNDQLWSMVH